jgi:hypothetical protein
MAGDFFLRAQKEVTKLVAPAHPCARDISASLHVKRHPRMTLPLRGTLGAALFRAAAPDSPSLAHGR